MQLWHVIHPFVQAYDNWNSCGRILTIFYGKTAPLLILRIHHP